MALGSRKHSAAAAKAGKAGKMPLKQKVLRIVVCVVLGILFAAPALFVNDVMGYIPIFAYLLALLLSYVYLRVLTKGLIFEQVEGGTGCVRGEKVRFSMAVRNTSVLPAVRVDALFYISDAFGGAGTTTRRTITIPPRSQKSFDFAVRFDHIGVYQVGVKEARMFDLLGLFSRVAVNEQLQDVSVEPRLVDVAHLEVSNDAAVEAKTTVLTVINEGMDYANVRDYRWGDPLKTIHWKLSARALDGDYYTRLYETATNPGIAIVVDFQTPDYDNEQLMDVRDTVVETALSIERYAAEAGMETELLFADAAGTKQRFPGPLEGHYADLLDKMPHCSAGDGLLALDIMRDEASSIYAQSNLAICTASVNSQLVGAMMSVKASKKAPLVMAVTPSGMDNDLRQETLKPLRRLEGTGIYYATLSAAEQVAEGGEAHA